MRLVDTENMAFGNVAAEDRAGQELIFRQGDIICQGGDILSILIFLPGVSCFGEEQGGRLLQAELQFPCSFS